MKFGITELKKQAMNNYMENQQAGRKYCELVGRMTTQEKFKFGIYE